MQHDVFQFFVDDLFLWFREVSAGFVQRSRLDDETQRRGRDRVGSQVDLASKLARGKVMTVTFEPEQAAAIRMGHEFALARVEIIGYRGGGSCQGNGTHEGGRD